MSGRVPVAEAALVGFGVWIAGGLLFGEILPFSRVPMYAAVGTQHQRAEAAIPVFRTGGRDVDPSQYERFVGDDPAFITFEEVCRPYHGCKSYPSSMPRDTWTRMWVVNHPGDPSAPGPVEVEFGFQMVTQATHGLEYGPFEVCWKGTAWPR